MELLLSDHEDRPNQHENSHKLCDETGHPVLSLTESQWKLRKPHDQKSIVEQILVSKERNSEEQDCECRSQGSE